MVSNSESVDDLELDWTLSTSSRPRNESNGDGGSPKGLSNRRELRVVSEVGFGGDVKAVY